MAPVRQASSTDTRWHPVVFVGVIDHGAAGFEVGGGAVKDHFLDRDNFALQIDGAFNTIGGYTRGCDIVGIDCNAHQLSFSGNFLYLFTKNTTSSGWVPYVGGGVLVIRTSLSVSDDTLDLGSSTTDGGIQGVGGIMKRTAAGRTVGGEVRLQAAGGGGFVALGRLAF